MDKDSAFKCVTKSCKEVHSPSELGIKTCNGVQKCIVKPDNVRNSLKVGKEKFLQVSIKFVEKIASNLSKKDLDTMIKDVSFSGGYMCRKCNKDFIGSDSYYVCPTCGNSYHLLCTYTTGDDDSEENAFEEDIEETAELDVDAVEESNADIDAEEEVRDNSSQSSVHSSDDSSYIEGV